MCCFGTVVSCSQTYILWKSMTNGLIRILYFSFTRFHLSVSAEYHVEDDFELFSADKSEILSLIYYLTTDCSKSPFLKPNPKQSFFFIFHSRAFYFLESSNQQLQSHFGWNGIKVFQCLLLPSCNNCGCKCMPLFQNWELEAASCPLYLIITTSSPPPPAYSHDGSQLILH